MGGGHQQGQADAANAAAGRSADANTALAQQFGKVSNNLTDTLFGKDAGGGGTLSGFLDPNKLNVNAPTGPYALQYQQAKANNATATDQAKQAITRMAGNSGFGPGAPAGYTNFLKSQADMSGAGKAGDIFSNYAGKSYQDALDNFWKATQAAQSTATNTGSGALTGNTSASNTYSQLYGTAQGAATSAKNANKGLAGSALGAAGAAAA